MGTGPWRSGLAGRTSAAERSSTVRRDSAVDRMRTSLATTCGQQSNGAQSFRGGSNAYQPNNNMRGAQQAAPNRGQQSYGGSVAPRQAAPAYGGQSFRGGNTYQPRNEYRAPQQSQNFAPRGQGFVGGGGYSAPRSAPHMSAPAPRSAPSFGGGGGGGHFGGGGGGGAHFSGGGGHGGRR